MISKYLLSTVKQQPSLDERMKKMKISSGGPRCSVRLEETAVEPAHETSGQMVSASWNGK